MNNFKAYYIARWASYVPASPDAPLWWDWYELLDGKPLPSGALLVEIFPLREAQVAELERIWNLP